MESTRENQEKLSKANGETRQRGSNSREKRAAKGDDEKEEEARGGLKGGPLDGSNMFFVSVRV